MLSAKNLTLRRGAKILFTEADFQIHDGWKIGISGRNGTGKSSFFRALLGELSIDSGDLSIPPSWTIAHVAQEAPASPDTLAQFTLDGDTELAGLHSRIASCTDDTELADLHAQVDAIDGYRAEQRAIEILVGLGFSVDDLERAVQTFSGGWRMRLALARSLMMRADLLLLDEPTNHLDLDAAIWLEQWLRTFKGTLLLISHDREFLDRIAQHILHFEQGRLKLYRGNYSEFEARRHEQLAQQQASYEKQQRERAAMEAFVTRFRAKATKARQAQSRLKALARMSLIAPAHVDSPFKFQFPELEPPAVPLLQLEDVDIGYDGQALLGNLRLQIAAGDRIGLLGANGAGKTSLLRCLAGKITPLRGTRREHDKTQTAYFTQDSVEMLDDDASPLLHVTRQAPDLSEQAARDFLGGFDFSADRALTAAGVLSGGERARLALALMVQSAPNLLLLDEPTNHLDIEMRLALNLAINAFKGALVLVSHDRHLLASVCDRLLLVSNGGVTDFEGDIGDYAQYRAAQRPDHAKASADTKAPGNTRRANRREAARQRAAQAPLRKRLGSIDKEMHELQAQITTLETQLGDASVYTDGDSAKLSAMNIALAQAKSQLSELEDEWLSVSETLDN